MTRERSWLMSIGEALLRHATKILETDRGGYQPLFDGRGRMALLSGKQRPISSHRLRELEF